MGKIDGMATNHIEGPGIAVSTLSAFITVKLAQHSRKGR